MAADQRLGLRRANGVIDSLYPWGTADSCSQPTADSFSQPTADRHSPRHSDNRGFLAHAEAKKLHGTQGELEQRSGATQRSKDFIISIQMLHGSLQEMMRLDYTYLESVGERLPR